MRKIKYILGSLFVFGTMTLAILAGYNLAFRDLIFPRIKIAGIEVTGMDKASALELISSYFKTEPSEVMLMSGDSEIVKLKGLKVEQDPLWAIDQAFGVGRNGNILTQITEQYRSLREGIDITVPVKLDIGELNDLIDEVVEKVEQKPIYPKLEYVGKKISIIKGKNGVEVKKDELRTEILSMFSLPGKHEISIPVNVVNTNENPELVSKAIEALEKWGDKRLTLRFRDFEKRLNFEEMINLFGLSQDIIDRNSFEDLTTEIKPTVEVESSDAIFVFEEGRVKEFKPEVIGATIDIPSLNQKLAEYLTAGEDKALEIPVILSYPKVKAGDINDLGIKELIGTGKSTFAHSIPGRVFNVNLAATRVNGTLVPPGEEFSFNASVGDISKATGYQSAYIISAGRTVLGDGGGVCQVSTTTFRAALDAGLPITERKAHAYRVGYYEQDSPPGIDATVFSPSADLKFMNDTGHYILIQEEVDLKKLSMKVNIYGTSDGRKSTITKPRISNQSAPPATLYVDDPTLPLGTTKQIDWSAWGAKVAFDYKVERGGETIYEKTFVSNYQPWQAIYLKGTGDLASR
ncbi:MAG: VanW family protein [Candidatus Collierbacteria bacterium GW2011_GWB1_44_6]|uniref:VanW family protein n=2 Tax=Candidatus Collieribacteriota TaxID=1752725 RepID=A0A0G1JPM1_9BACT|nr:MAG: VanW family protein [Candidatus Collierbacteria bacterium GW2011_GWC2_43_12]KKT73273.1 MAG: VanW family protein [Candidatus Collierbacteria bacterium GW2011_GWB1_44_6]KKT83609.1 MAG: VanW family protein [Microgenomates group bacterium GW2011_GWC1_44_9]